MEKHLKDKQHYIDLYDRHTVEQCRITEKLWNEKELPPLEGEEPTKEGAERRRHVMMEYCLHFKTGERYLNKEETIREWMKRDQGGDDLYERAEAPEGIRCLACRNLVKPTLKEFWSSLDKPDRVLFIYDCPNECVPHRAFFSDGEEWRTKPDLCPDCNAKLNRESTDTDEKLITKYTCPQCDYTKTDEIEWTHKKDEGVDENFAADRDRFCLTEGDGEKFRNEKFQIEQMAKFMEEWKKKEKAREEKLKENPKGFHLEGAGYRCPICHDNTPEGDNWYDEYGIKCLVCQKAIDEGEIPASLAKDEDSWYSKHDLESRFNVKTPTLRKWIRDGIIKARTVSRYGQGVHVQVFLLEDNKDFLPPKNLTESQSVTERKDGKDWSRTEPWYRFVGAIENLKGYRIMEHLRVVPAEEMAAREEDKKKKWEAKQARRKERQTVKRKGNETR